MKMEIMSVQPIYVSDLRSNKIRDWTIMSPPTTTTTTTTTTNSVDVNVVPKKAAIKKSSSSSSSSSTSSSSSSSSSLASNSIKHSSSNSSSNKKTKSSSYQQQQQQSIYYNNNNNNNYNNNNCYNNDDLALTGNNDYPTDSVAVRELSERLLDELRAAKSRHLTCTEVSLPCDLTPSIAAEIIRVSEKEPCGIRGCTIYIEFEDEPKNSRRIASMKLDPETVSTFEVYLTLRQDHRGWTSLLPQFMKSLARTITISPEYTITKHKLYSADGLGARRSYSFGSSQQQTQAQAIATPTI